MHTNAAVKENVNEGAECNHAVNVNNVAGAKQMARMPEASVRVFKYDFPRYCNVYVVLDSASDITICLIDLVNQLGMVAILTCASMTIADGRFDGI